LVSALIKMRNLYERQLPNLFRFGPQFMTFEIDLMEKDRLWSVVCIIFMFIL